MKAMGKNAFLFFLFLFFPAVVNAETSLFLSPIVGSYDTNTVFQVNILVSTGDEKVNAVDAKLSFDPKEIEVDRIEISDSILSSWALEPRYDNQIGEIVFSGLMSASSSFSGERGKILSLFLRGLRSTESSLRFDASSAAVLASDGTGGNVLAETKAGVYLFSPKNSVPELPQSINDVRSDGEVLGATTGSVVSRTHPDSSAWYASSDASFSWSLEKAVSQVSLALTKSDDIPVSMKKYDPISSKDISDIDDGTWYFHIAKEFGDGTIEREVFRINIDSIPPRSLSLLENDRDSDDPNVSFEISAEDDLSGINQIELILDGGDPVFLTTGATSTKQFSISLPGTYTLVARAFDRAGNTISKELTFSVDALPTPQVALRDEKLSEGDVLSISGSAKGKTELWVERLRVSDGEKTSEHITVADDGIIDFLGTIKLLPGEYDVVFRVKDSRGGVSLDTESVRVHVSPTLPGILKRHPAVLLSVLILISLIAIITFYVKRKFLQTRRKPPESISQEIPHVPHEKGLATTFNARENFSSGDVVDLRASRS